MFSSFGVGIFSSLILLGVYLLESYAIYRLAVVRGLPSPILAFIPFFQLYMLGQIGDSLRYQSYRLNDLLGRVPLAYALPLISIIGSFLRYPLSLLSSLVLSVATLVVYYLVYSYYERKWSVAFTVLTCLPSVMFLFSILSAVPLVGHLLAPVLSILRLLSSLSPIIGPLLVLFCLRGYRSYR